jgi:hypothetical protein
VLKINQRFGNDYQLGMLARNVEVVNIIPQVVAIGEGAATRTDRQMKRQTALASVAAGMHARLHDAFTHRRRVSELRKVSDRIEHAVP